MLNHSDIMSTIDMIDHLHLDIRTITMGLSLLDCADPTPKACAQKIYNKICRQAEHLVETGCDIERELGIPIVDAAEALTIHSPAAASAAISASVSAAAPLLKTPELHPDVSVNAVPFPDVADIEEQLRRNLMKQLVRRTEV